MKNKIYILALFNSLVMACAPEAATNYGHDSSTAEVSSARAPVATSDDPALDAWRADCRNASRAVPALWLSGAKTYRESTAFPGGSNGSLIFRLEYSTEVTEAEQKARATFLGKYLPSSHAERVRDPLAPTDDSRRTWSLVRDVAAPFGDFVGDSGVEPAWGYPPYDGPICEEFCWQSPDSSPGGAQRSDSGSDAQCSGGQCCKVFCY